MIDPAIRRADARFVLPRAPVRAAVLGPDDGWGAALALAGTSVVSDGSEVDLAVAPGDRVADAVATGAETLLLEGPAAAGPLRSAGYHRARFLVLPDARHPELVIPLGATRSRRYAIRRRTAGAPTGRRLAALAAAEAMARVPRAVRPDALLTVATQAPAAPFPLAAAVDLGLPREVDWHLLLGRSDELAERRMAFVAATPGSAVPSWAVKVARVPGLGAGFDGDERGLATLRLAAPDLAGHAPRLLGRGATGDLLLSVETAAVGDRLTEALRRRGQSGVGLTGAIAQWLVDLGVASRTAPGSVAAELAALEAEMGPTWGTEVDLAGLFGRVADLPGALVHGDLGTWNVVTDGTDFTVIDWESTRAAGLPMWDLLHLLGDACTQMARQARPADRSAYLAALFAGETALSPLVFDWTRRAAAAMDVPDTSVGVIATLGWLHRAVLVGRPATGSAPSPSQELARRWLADPRLGSTWSTWR